MIGVWEPPVARSTRAAGYVLAWSSRPWEAEVARMRVVAKRWGWDLARTWEEEARFWLAGVGRPAFTAMLGELGPLEVGVVLVPEVAALSIDPVERSVMVRRIGQAGAIVSELPRRRWSDWGLRWRR